MDDLADPAPRLTPREIEIVRYLICGDTERSVARKLKISRYSVHSQIANVHRKLGVSSRGRLVAEVIVRGFVPLTEVCELLGFNQTGD